MFGYYLLGILVSGCYWYKYHVNLGVFWFENIGVFVVKTKGWNVAILTYVYASMYACSRNSNTKTAACVSEGNCHAETGSAKKQETRKKKKKGSCFWKRGIYKLPYQMTDSKSKIYFCAGQI